MRTRPGRTAFRLFLFHCAGIYEIVYVAVVCGDLLRIGSRVVQSARSEMETHLKFKWATPPLVCGIYANISRIHQLGYRILGLRFS